MKLLGSITYDWRGEQKQAVTSPDVRIVLDVRWVAVSRPTGGTELVPWESVRELSGWSPVTEEDR